MKASVAALILTSTIVSNAATPIVHWTFDGEDPLEATGQATTTKGNGPKQVEGKKGKALKFDGKSFLKIDTDLTSLNEAFTISYWMKCENPPGGYLSMIDAGGNRAVNIRIWNRQGIDYNVGNFWHLITEQAPAIKQEWTHVAATYDGKEAKLYVNGKLLRTAKQEHESRFSHHLTIGGRVNLTKEGAQESEYYTGLLDEVAIFNTVLAGEEIASLGK